MSQAVENKKAEVLQFDPGQPDAIPIEAFNNRTRSSTKLVNNANESNFMQGRNHAYWFELKEPMYVSTITVDVESYRAYNKLEFRWVSQRDGEEHSFKSKVEDDVFGVTIQDIITKFCIKPPKQYLSNAKLKNVEVTGVTLDEFDDVMEAFGNLDKTKRELRAECNSLVTAANEAEANIAKLMAKKSELTTEITQLKGDRTTAEQEAELAQSELEEVKSGLVARRSEESDAKSRIEKIEDGIDQKKKESEVLNTEITERRRELKALKDDVNMFPSEIGGYVKQGSRNLRHYAVLAMIPIALLVLFVWVLFSNAVDLTTVYQRRQGIDLWTMFLSRVPFAVIAIFIITACYKIAKVFILEFIRISNRRLDLTKVSIVAQDVSDASTQGLDFTDEEIYELNTKLKMNMLKSHLKGYVADDYEYDIDVTLWDRFKKAFAKRHDDVKKET